MTACKTCELVADRDRGDAPFWDCFYRTDYWDVVHKSETTLPGWLILVTRRHLNAIDQLNEAEAGELGVLIHQTSNALKEVVGCVKTYVIQFAEHPDHPHVHFHIIPRMADVSDDHRGVNVFNYDATGEKEAISDAEMNDIANKVRPFLTVKSKPVISR